MLGGRATNTVIWKKKKGEIELTHHALLVMGLPLGESLKLRKNQGDHGGWECAYSGGSGQEHVACINRINKNK